MLDFDWDPRKAEENLRKHGVPFEDAALVFTDPRLLTWCYRRGGEERWSAIGLAAENILFVVYTLRGPGDSMIRIISARDATNRERRAYRRLGRS